MDGIALLTLARALAQVKHAEQLRRGTGEPYFNHVDRVAERCYGWQAKTVAFLHDLVEDTDITAETLLLLGFPRGLVDSVNTLTRHYTESYDTFIERIAASGDRRAIQVKLADLEDNLNDLDEALPPHEARLRRVRYTDAASLLYRALEAAK